MSTPAPLAARPDPSGSSPAGPEPAAPERGASRPAPTAAPQALGRLLPFVRPYRGRVVLAGLLLLAAATTTLVFPLALKALIDQGLLKKIEESGLGPIVLEIQIRFSRENRLRETVAIRSETEAWDGGKTMAMTQTMLNDKGEACCVARFLFGLFDTRLRKLVRPTPDWCYAVGVDPA